MYDQVIIQDMSAIIENIRKKCLIEFQQNPELYHEIDVNRVRDDNWQIEKFIIEHEIEDKAYDSLIKSLRWKKSFGIHDRNDQYFPKEFFELGEYETYGRDKEGRIIHWETTRNTRKIPEFVTLEKQFAAHILEKLNSEGSRDGFIIVSDTFGTGLANINLEIVRFKVGLSQYYPQSMRQVLVVNLPWILNSVLKIVMSFVSPKLRKSLKFINKEQLTDYVDIDLIPAKLNGKRLKKIFPDRLLPMDQLTHLGLNDSEINKFYDTFKHLFGKK